MSTPRTKTPRTKLATILEDSDDEEMDEKELKPDHILRAFGFTRYSELDPKSSNYKPKLIKKLNDFNAERARKREKDDARADARAKYWEEEKRKSMSTPTTRKQGGKRRKHKGTKHIHKRTKRKHKKTKHMRK